jgi:hypothetical protein
MDQRIRDGRALDQALLGELGAEIAAVLQALGADNREGEVMPDAGGDLGCGQVPAGSLEEIHRGLVLERGRVGNVDDDVDE